MSLEKIIKQVDEIIDAARVAQSESHGLDADYRRMANEDVRKQRQALIDMLIAEGVK